MIYEFQCKKCGKVFEEIRRLAENTNDADCPSCKSEGARIASKFGFKIVGFASINGYSHGNR